MPTTIVLNGEHLRLEDVGVAARGGATVTLSDPLAAASSAAAP